MKKTKVWELEFEYGYTATIKHTKGDDDVEVEFKFEDHEFYLRLDSRELQSLITALEEAREGLAT